MKNQNFKIFILAFGILLVFGFFQSVWTIQKNESGGLKNLFTEKMEPALAEDIYPLFVCPCSSRKRLDIATCGMAKQRRAYIDGLTQAGKLSKEEVISIYVKKYGLDSFYSKEKKEEYRQKLIKEAPADRPIISFTTDFYDFGKISQKKGKIMTFFEIKNDGKSDLVITGLATSCNCTSASIVFRGKDGPVFSMPGHGINEKVDKNWKVVIPPGKTAELKIHYDPNVHKKFRGAGTREISVFSNDPIYSEKKVKIEFEQID